MCRRALSRSGAASGYVLVDLRARYISHKDPLDFEDSFPFV
jgi:hypothetical protein